MAASYVPLIPAYGMLSDLGDTVSSQQAAQEAAAKELWQRAQASAIASGQEPPPMPAPRQGMLQRLMGAISPAAEQQAPQQPATSAGQPQATPSAGPQGGEKVDYIRRAAADRWIDPEIAVKVAASEGLNGAVGDQGSSFGPFQLHYGGVAPGGNRVGGLGDEFTRATGLNARDPNTWREQVNFALDQAKKGGWEPFHGAAKSGIDAWAGIRNGPVQVADASGRVQIGGQAQPAGAPQNDAMKAWPKALQTLPGIMSAMQNPYMKPIAEKALEAYNKANSARPTVLSGEEAQRKYNAPADFKGIVFEDEKGQPHIQKFGPDAQTTVNLAGEKEYERTVGKGYGETMLDIQKQGRAAQNSLTSLKLMEKAIETPGFYSGSSSDAVTAARKVAVSLGIADAASAAPNELFTKIGNKLVLDLAGGSLGTGFSNADRDYLAASVPNLANTPEGNKQIIQIMKKVEGRRAEVAKFARDYAKFHDGRLDQGFDDALAQWSDQNKLFPETEKAGAVAKPVPKLGSVPIPPDRARALRQHPDLRDAFDQTYGKGAADQVLGATGGPQL